MPTVADYRVIRDTTFTLGINKEESFSFQVPNDLVISQNAARAILNFKYDPSSNANNLRFEVNLNGQLVTSLSNIDNGLRRFESETFNSTILEVNGNNTLQFRVEASSGNASGSIGFSDIVVWYQVPA